MFINEIRKFLKPQGKGLAVGAGCGSTPQDLESESVCRERMLHIDTVPDGRCTDVSGLVMRR